MPAAAVVSQDAAAEGASWVAGPAPSSPNDAVLAGDGGDRVSGATVGQLLPVGTRRTVPGCRVGPDVFATGHPVPPVGTIGREGRDEPRKRVVGVDVGDRGRCAVIIG